VRIKRCLVLAGTAAVLFGLGGPAFADPDEDVLSGFDDDAPLVSNVTVAPVQMCGSGVLLGLLEAPSQKTGACTNAPTGDPFQQLVTNSKVG
jgi:hypothetical protein